MTGPLEPPPERTVESVLAVPTVIDLPVGGDSSEKYVDWPGASAGEKFTTPLLNVGAAMPVNHEVGPS